MNPYFERPDICLCHGDCVEVMRSMAEASIDAVVTDPPAGIGFMGKEFDHDRGGRREWIAWLADCPRDPRSRRMAGLGGGAEAGRRGLVALPQAPRRADRGGECAGLFDRRIKYRRLPNTAN